RCDSRTVIPSHPVCFSALRPPPSSTLFPYTTLFRSSRSASPLISTSTRGCAASVASSTPHSRRKRWFQRWRRPSGAKTAIASKRSEEHTSELQSRENLVCRLLLEKKKKQKRKLKNYN